MDAVINFSELWVAQSDHAGHFDIGHGDTVLLTTKETGEKARAVALEIVKRCKMFK